jgi:ABC-type transport system involved in multi-copper enzyme maturation permease subunit
MAQTQKLTQRPGFKSFNFKKLPGRWIINLGRNPIILKELRGRMRSWRSLFVLALYVGLLSLFAVLTYAVTVNQSNSSYYNGYYSYPYYYSNNYEQLGTGIFTAIIVVQLVLIGLLAPGYTVGVLSGEKERQTYEILLLTLLQPHEIVFGKLFSTLLFLFLMVIAAIPVESIVFLIGGVGLDQLVLGLVIPLLTVLLVGSLGIAWSSLMRTTQRASRMAYFSGLVLLGGVPALGIPLGLMIYGFRGSTDFGIFLLNWASTFNPAVAIIGTNILLGGGGGSLREVNAFYYIRSNGDFYPMPWVLFLIMALALSAFFITFAIRFVKPLKTEGEVNTKKKK